MYIHHRLVFVFFSLSVSVSPSASMQEDALALRYLAPLTGCTCSRAPLFLSMELPIWLLRLYLTVTAQEDSFLSHLFLHCFDRIPKA